MTRLMVLGLLRVKPMSGYEIKQILQTSQTDKWAGILPGSIYHALKKMNQEGLVKVDAVETTGHRSKAIYRITSSGEEEVNKLIIESFEQSSVVVPTALYTGLSMLSMPNTVVDKSRLRKALEKQIRVLEEEVRELERGKKLKAEATPLDSLTVLTFENLFAQYKLQLGFLSQVINELEKE